MSAAHASDSRRPDDDALRHRRLRRAGIVTTVLVVVLGVFGWGLTRMLAAVDEDMQRTVRDVPAWQEAPAATER